MENDELNQSKDRYSNVQNELARLNKSIDDIKIHLEQDRKISQSRWVSNIGYIFIALGVAALGIAATLKDSAATIICGGGMIIIGLALLSVSGFLYPKIRKESELTKTLSGNKPIAIKWKNVVITITVLIAMLMASHKSKIRK